MPRVPFPAALVRVSILCLGMGLHVGCQPHVPLVDVEGVLLLDDQPFPNVLVTFVPEAAGLHTPIRSMGMTDASGSFTLRAETLSPGAVLGEHRVIVEDLAILNAPRTEDGTVISLPAQRFPSIYSDALKTPLRTTLQVGTQPIELRLQSNL